MMEHGLVSIIMAVYNGADFLSEAIESVINQTYPSWELLVSNDGSTDKSLHVARAYAETEPRIILVSDSVRGGPAAARNRAIDKARGCWLAFLDSDDTWHPEKLRLTLRFAEDNNLALACTAYFRQGPGARTSFIGVPAQLGYGDLLKSNHVATSTVLVDRAQLPDFKMNEDFGFDDYIAWLEILKRGLPAGGLATPLTIYRKRKGSFSHNKLFAARRVFAVYRRQQLLSWPKTLWFFLNYSLRGVVKHSPLRGFFHRTKRAL